MDSHYFDGASQSRKKLISLLYIIVSFALWTAVIGASFWLTLNQAKENAEEFEAVESYSNFEDTELADLLAMIIYSEYNVDFGVFLELCKRLNLNILDCVSSAWNEIKDRKGRTEGGVFIKDEK